MPCLASVTKYKACVANMRTMEGALEMYDMDSNIGFAQSKGPGKHPYPAKLMVDNKYLKNMPECRNGGTYSVLIHDAENQENGQYSNPELECSYHGTIENPDFTYKSENLASRFVFPKTVFKTILVPGLLTFWILIRIRRYAGIEKNPATCRFDVFSLYASLVGLSWFLIGSRWLPVKHLASYRGSNGFELMTGALTILMFLVLLVRILINQPSAESRRAAVFYVSTTGIVAMAFMTGMARRLERDTFLIILFLIPIAFSGLGILSRLSIIAESEKEALRADMANGPEQSPAFHPHEDPES
jgi:hypothetical protein